MPTTDPVLLGTHALLWWRADGDLLSRATARRIVDARHVLVSPISCWEIGLPVAKGTVKLDRPVTEWVTGPMSETDVEEAALIPAVAVAVAAAALTGMRGDPADRMLVSTAVARGCRW